MWISRFLRCLSLVCALALLSGCAFVPAADRAARPFELTAEERSYLDSLRERPIEIAYSYDLIRNGMLIPVLDVLENDFGLTVNLRKLNWEEAFAQVESGEADYYGPVALSDMRKSKYVTAGPFYRSYTEIVSRVADPINSLPGLYNRKVGLLTGSIISKTIQTYLGPDGGIVYLPAMEDMIDGLRTGRIDAFATVDNAELEILAYPDIRYEFSVENFYADQGFISSREELRMLSELLNRYLGENPQVMDEIVAERRRAILQNRRTRLSEEIRYLRSNYDEVEIYADAFLYPLCYARNGTADGMQLEINGIFEELTGVPVRVATRNELAGGLPSALDKLESGDCMAIAGVYYDMDMWNDPGKRYSPVVWTDTLRMYSYSDIGGDLHGKSVGTMGFASDYVGWDVVTGNAPALYNSHEELLSAMSVGGSDAVFMGELAFNYSYTVLGDYGLREVAGISADANVHMLYNMDNSQFNALYDEAVLLFQALNPKVMGEWKSRSERYKSDYIRMRSDRQVWTTVVIMVFVILMAALYSLLWRNKRAYEDVEEKNRTIINGMEYARGIQKNLLPADGLFREAFSDYSVIWEPRDMVGGDIYWLRNFDGGSVLCVCDCTGHGTSGALLTMLVVSALEAIVNEKNYMDTARIMFRLDSRISSLLSVGASPESKGGGIFDLNEGCDLVILSLAKDGEAAISAGNMHVFVCDGNEVRQIKGQRLHVGDGCLSGPDDVRVVAVPANPANKFYIASDGLYDQIGGEHARPFGYKSIKEIILENHKEDQAVISGRIWEDFEAYRGGHSRRDDVQLVTFKP